MTQTVLLGEVVRIKGGKRLPKGEALQESPNSHPYLRIVDMGEKFIKKTNLQYVPNSVFPKISRYITNTNDVLLSIVGTIGLVAIVDDELDNASLTENCVKLTCDMKKIDPGFLYYFLTSSVGQDEIRAGRVGSTQPKLPLYNIAKIRVPNLILEEQKKIADILGTIDEKIELNRKMNETLEQVGQALFRHYFINNPDAERWKDGTLGDIIINFDSRRKPLSSRQRAEIQGEYRYFGATSVMDHVNDYLFDGRYLLLAEDGSVIKSDGTPYLQYVWGKFWVNNHAHILQAKEPFTIEYLYLLLSQANVQSLVSGAVQLKINQKAMNSLKLKLPPDELVRRFCNKIDPMFAQWRNNNEESQALTTVRDNLLPWLMSGKIKI